MYINTQTKITDEPNELKVDLFSVNWFFITTLEARFVIFFNGNVFIINNIASRIH